MGGCLSKFCLFVDLRLLKQTLASKGSGQRNCRKKKTAGTILAPGSCGYAVHYLESMQTQPVLPKERA